MKNVYLAIFALFFCLQFANAQVIYVKPTGTGSGSSWSNAAGNLKNVLDTAASGDTIWVAQGTYYPSLDSNQDTSFYLKDNVAIYGGFIGTETSLSARADTTGALTFLSGDLGHGYHSQHVVYGIDSLDSTALLNGFTITCGISNVDSVFGGGAGMYNEGSPILTNVIFKNDTTNLNAPSGTSFVGGGGGMCNLYGSPRLINVSFINNTLNITTTATYLSGRGGGGALYTDSGNIQVINAKFIGNVTATSGTATGYGGGGAIYVDDSRSQIQITNALFVNNYGYPTNQVFGSGIYALGTNVTVTNATFSGNSFYPIYALFDTFSIQNSILDYTAYSYYATLIINNTYLGYGVDGTGSASPYYTGSNDIYTSVPPSFVDTSRGNYTLLPCSATINAGNDSFNYTSTDLSGKPRKYGTIDMGAYEYQRPNTMPDTVYVNAAATDPYANGASWADAFSDLSLALNLSCSGTHAKQIWVAKGTYAPSVTGNRQETFVIANDMQVYGGFAGTETSLTARDSTSKTNITILTGEIQNDSDATNNSYHVVYANTDSSSQLNGFTITGGYGNGGSLSLDIFGGGIFNAAGNTLYANLIIKNNRASFGGGGFANFDGSPRLVNVKFFNDTSTGIGGGGMYSDGSGTFILPGLVSYAKKCSPVLLNDSFVNCFNSFGGGGLIVSTGSVVADSVVFLNNTASDYGGGIMGDNASLFLTHCALIGNSTSDIVAGARGGGIYDDAVDTSYVILNDVLIAKNQGGPGGGIYLFMNTDTSVFNNVTFFGNININNDTIYGSGGNALYADGGTTLYPAPTALKIWNSIIDSVNNGTSSIGGGTSGTSVRNTLFEGSFPTGATDGGGNLAHKDPLFVDTATGDYRLQKCSPAVNAGNDTLLDTTITTDLAGQPRRYGGSIVDMGAYEYQGYVAKLPAAAITAGTLAFCSGDSILLTANKDSGLHYQWQLNDTDIVGDTLSTMYVHTSGDYRVVITDISSCSGTSAVDTTIEHPLPKPVISDTLTTLSTTKYATYQWYRDGKLISGATDSSYRYTLSGDYTVFVTDSNGCGKMSDTEDVNAEGVKKLASQDAITIYPNPVTSTFHIAAPVNVNITISDMQGKLLLYKENETNIDISYFANGVYMLRITDSQGTLLKTEKLIKMSN